MIMSLPIKRAPLEAHTGRYEIRKGVTVIPPVSLWSRPHYFKLKVHRHSHDTKMDNNDTILSALVMNTLYGPEVACGAITLLIASIIDQITSTAPRQDAAQKYHCDEERGTRAPRSNSSWLGKALKCQKRH